MNQESKNNQRRLTRQELAASNVPKKGSQLRYADFKKLILDFQLQEHERFLFKFTDLFKNIDEDQDGILDEDQFRGLIEAMNVVDQQEIDTLLQKVDPFNNQKMTYSEVVHLLSGHLTNKSEEDNEQVPILEKFINAGVDEDLEQLNNDLP